jgi:hypothetical protein
VSVADRSAPLGERALGWARRHAPTPESIQRSRVLRPVAHRLLAPALWRFNRRSVPRGVALGMGTGILLPFAHMPLAAALALPARANIPIAVMLTLVSNPLTFVEIVWLEHTIGRFVLRLDAGLPGQPVREVADMGWLHWLMSGAGTAAVGALVLAPIVAAAGYAGAALGWRWWTARRWARRHRR